MAMKPLSTLMMVIVFVVATTSLSGYSSAADESERNFLAADPKNPYVVKLGQLAVEESKIKGLYFDHVLEAAYKKESRDSIYDLVISARGQWGVGNYSAELLVRGNDKKLVTIKERSPRRSFH